VRRGEGFEKDRHALLPGLNAAAAAAAAAATLALAAAAAAAMGLQCLVGWAGEQLMTCHAAGCVIGQGIGPSV
jgi:hypothetical protein